MVVRANLKQPGPECPIDGAKECPDAWILVLTNAQIAMAVPDIRYGRDMVALIRYVQTVLTLVREPFARARKSASGTSS